LLQADYFQLKNNHTQAPKFYDLAIKQAQTQGFTQDVGIANEKAASYWRNQKKPDKETQYLKNALQSYRKWGALLKEKQLLKKYPQLK